MPILTTEIDEIQDIIGIRFRKPAILQQAFVHCSYLNERKYCAMEHNERLEFLGDAILECITTVYLYRNYSKLAEGEMTALRAALVNSRFLGKIADELGLGTYILMSKGQRTEFESHGRGHIHLLANCLEAVIGAIHCDGGMGRAELFCLEFLLPRLEVIRKNKLYLDPKSHYQELIQEKLKITPRYRMIEESGPDHAKEFIVGVFHGEDCVMQGKGCSLREAQDEAARLALKEQFQIELPQL